ncbi:MAG: SWIM zinc finger family protein [Terracidiphilus sp.]|nr:SWIM zinc finger family protein [Terracidiphilus sp.]
MYDDFGWRPYVPVAERRRRALKKMEGLSKKGRIISPVSVDVRAIAKTFWGKAWCENLESYSDYENRLPRGRAYVRNGSVVDLQIAASQITALVSGSEMYEVKVEILPVAKQRWKSICEDCAGSIDSLVELLQGRLSKGVMERISQQQTGLFPSPKEIKLSCSCPDWAEMCKHVAAVLYGVGARLDQQPELLFRLRAVNEKELIASAGKSMPRAQKSPAKVLGGEDLSKLFGLDLADSAPLARSAPATKGRPVAKVTRVLETHVTKAIAVATKIRPAKKAAKARAKPSAPSMPVAAPTKPKPAKKSASKGLASMKKTEIVSPKSGLPAATKKSVAVAGKAKPTRRVPNGRTKADSRGFANTVTRIRSIQ